MLSYRDMTFCKEQSCALFGVICDRSWTPEQEAKAKEWWEGCEGEPPVMFHATRPSCFHQKGDQYD